jgi:hypothetical protein
LAVGIVEGVLAYHVAVRLSDLVELVKQGANRLLALHFRDRLKLIAYNMHKAQLLTNLGGTCAENVLLHPFRNCLLEALPDQPSSNKIAVS